MHASVVRNHWYTGQALSQLQRLCPALPGVRQPPSSVRGTCIVVPHAALLAVPDAPPRFFADWARSAPVPLTPPWPHLAKYNAARWLITARARTPGRSPAAFIAHWARRLANLAKYNVARWLVMAQEKTQSMGNEK